MLLEVYNKLKQIARVIFPVNQESDKWFEKKIGAFHNLEKLEVKRNIYYLHFIHGLKIAMRDRNHSDIDVYKQVFIDKEYDIIHWILNLNHSKSKIIVIDAGANVGYTSLFFSLNFEDYQIYAIEPSFENCRIFSENISLNDINVKLYQNALTDSEGKKFDLDRDFRDSKDWSITTSEKIDGLIEGITINEIINKNNLPYISLLKIDIEGAERFLFVEGVDLNYLKVTNLITIEIHDEFNIRQEIYSILKSNGFLIFNSGELTIGVNSKMTF
jgi:FkbM family methyltransferase